ncbi:MAG: hypothetical protein ACP5XB_29535 [Isosphaeraceae bacterium]
MGDIKSDQTTTNTHEQSLGLLANGSSGPWDVSIDETISGNERWFAQIEGTSICLYFELPSLDMIPEAIRFLAPPAERVWARAGSSTVKGELLISKRTELPVLLVRDDEFEDRFFVVVGQPDRPVVRCSLSSSAARDILEALRQAEKDLPGRTHPGNRTNGATYHGRSDMRAEPMGFMPLWSFADENLADASRLLNFMARCDFKDVRIESRDFEFLKSRFQEDKSVHYRWDIRSHHVREIARFLQVHAARLKAFLREHGFDPSKTYNPNSRRRDLWIDQRWKRF